ncbi:hypothetical protein D3C80_1599700 [compost metagenome]
MKSVPVRQTPAAMVAGGSWTSSFLAAITHPADEIVDSNRKTMPIKVFCPEVSDAGIVSTSTPPTARRMARIFLMLNRSFRNTEERVSTAAGARLVKTEATIAVAEENPYSRKTVYRTAPSSDWALIATHARRPILLRAILSNTRTTG